MKKKGNTPLHSDILKLNNLVVKRIRFDGALFVWLKIPLTSVIYNQ